MPTISIYRPGDPATLQATVEIDEQTIYRKQLMGEHKVVLNTIVSAALDVRVGDYITVGTEQLKLNQAPSPTRTGNNRLEYNMVFEGVVYDLLNKLFMDEGSAQFSYAGTASEFIDLLITNITEIDEAWEKGTVDSSVFKTLQFDQDSCRTALTKIAEAFGMEFTVDGKSIDLKLSVGADTTLTFSYGQGNGLYGLSRLNIDDKNIVTRVYGFGSTRNLNYDYRSGAKRLVFDDLKLEANVATYGVREGVYTNEDIYPNRTGAATAVTNTHASGVYKLVDSSIDFNLNDYFIEGVDPKIVFKSGELSGREFAITHYDHGSKEITYAPFTDANGYTQPNATFEAAVSDEYTLVGIALPQSYIDTAEAALEAATQTYLDQNSVPRVTYELVINPLYVLENAVSIAPGDRVTIEDTGLGIDELIRVNAIEYPLVLSSQITAQISDTITYTVIERTIARSIDNQTKTFEVDRTSTELARQNVQRMRQLQNLIFDPDGYFDPENIKPLSIETLMLAVGAKSQNFVLNDVEIEANYEGDQNKLRFSAGELVHLEIAIEGLGATWSMAAQTFSTLVTGNTYYLYARCSKSALTGGWKVSTAQIGAEDETGYYHFLLGILYAADGGKRFYQITKGMTFINGDTITTGKIQSQDGLSYLDLSNNTFKIGDGSNSIDWGVTTADTLTIKGAVMSDFIMANLAYIENLGVRYVKTSDTGKRVEIDGADNSVKIYDTNGDLVIKIDDDIDSDGTDLPGIELIDPAASFGMKMTRKSLLVQGNTADGGALSGTIKSTIKAAAGALRQVAAIAGIEDATGTGDVFGGLFNTALIQGLHLGAVNVTGSMGHSVAKDETLIDCDNSSPITVYLPAAAKQGRVVIVRQNTANDVTVDGNGTDLYRTSAVSSLNINDADHTLICLRVGAYWRVIKLTP